MSGQSTVLEDISELMKVYFQGLYQGDVDALRTIFHDDLRYLNLSKKDATPLSLSEYMDLVQRRDSPEQLGENRQGIKEAIEALQVVGENMVFVHATMNMFHRHYQDCLTLARDDRTATWRILFKAFSYQTMKTPVD